MNTGELVTKIRKMYHNKSINEVKVAKTRGAYQILKEEAIKDMDGRYDERADAALKRYIMIAMSRLEGGNVESYRSYFTNRFEDVKIHPKQAALAAQDIKAEMEKVLEERNKS